MKAFDKGIEYLLKNNQSEIINLGTKQGFSNLSIFKSFKKFYKYKFEEPFLKIEEKGMSIN